jgi:hypothetical protein
LPFLWLFEASNLKEPRHADLTQRHSLDYSINNSTIFMADLGRILHSMRVNPKGIRFTDLCKVCDHFFGNARQSGTSHRVYKMPWKGDPRVNIQSSKGMAKAYQVKQVLKALERLEIVLEEDRGQKT